MTRFRDRTSALGLARRRRDQAPPTARRGARLGKARAGEGYLTGNSAELHFGLGLADEVDQFEVQWPDGTTTARRDVAIDRAHMLRRP